MKNQETFKYSLLLTVFGLTIFVKNVLFYRTCFHSLLFSSILTDPLEFLVFYGAKALPALFLMAIMLLTRKAWWTILVSFVLDVWCVTNILYYNFFNLFFTWDVLSLAGNMDGFWGSLLPYLNMSIWIYPLITLLYAVLFLFLHNSFTKSYCWVSFMMLLAILVSDIGINKYRVDKWYSATSKEEIAWESLKGSLAGLYYPFGLMKIWGLFTDSWGNQYVQAQSVTSYFAASILDYFHKYVHMRPSLTENDTLVINQFIFPDQNDSLCPKYNLLFILVESMEYWPLQDTINGNIITPNLNHFIADNHVLYCPKIKSQIRKGGSGDGQMIVNTGLLPITEGAACTSYGDDVFPNYAHLFVHSSIINPTPKAWNQSCVTYSYGYHQLIEPADRWHDADIMLQIDSLLNSFTTNDFPSCVFAITYNSHSPFARPGGAQLMFEPDMPSCMASYLDCINYVDSCMALILDSYDKDSTILIITGDHIIFKDAMLKEYLPYAEKAELSIRDGHTYCPLIIYSPDFDSDIIISDTCYQMDIYPTIMHLIGCEDYYWKGFGVNLLDSAARNDRPITEQEAYRLSDLMIRSNYFKAKQ